MTEKKFHFNINQSYDSDSSEDNGLKTNMKANGSESDDSFELTLPSTFTNKNLSLEAPNYVRSKTYKTDNFHTVQKMSKGGKGHSVFYQQKMINSSSSSSMDEDVPNKNSSLSSKKKVVSYSSSSEEDILPVKTIKETNMKNTFLKLENQLTLKSDNNKNLSKNSNLDKEIYRSANANNSFQNEKPIKNKFNKENHYHAILRDDIKKDSKIDEALLDKTKFDWHCRFKGFSRPGHHKKIETIHKFIPIDGTQFAVMEGMIENIDEKPKVSVEHLKIIAAERTLAAKIHRKIYMEPKTLVDQNMDVKDYKHSTEYGTHVRVYEISEFVQISEFFDARGHTKVVDLKFNHPVTGSEVSALFVIGQIESLIVGTKKLKPYKYYIHQADDKLPTIVLSFNKGNMTLRQLWVFYGKPGDLEDLDSKTDQNEYAQFLKQFNNLNK